MFSFLRTVLPQQQTQHGTIRLEDPYLVDPACFHIDLIHYLQVWPHLKQRHRLPLVEQEAESKDLHVEEAGVALEPAMY